MKFYKPLAGDTIWQTFTDLYNAFQESAEPITCKFNDFRIILMNDEGDDNKNSITISNVKPANNEGRWIFLENEIDDLVYPIIHSLRKKARKETEN